MASAQAAVQQTAATSMPPHRRPGPVMPWATAAIPIAPSTRPAASTSPPMIERRADADAGSHGEGPREAERGSPSEALGQVPANRSAHRRRSRGRCWRGGRRRRTVPPAAALPRRARAAPRRRRRSRSAGARSSRDRGGTTRRPVTATGCTPRRTRRRGGPGRGLSARAAAMSPPGARGRSRQAPAPSSGSPGRKESACSAARPRLGRDRPSR